MKTAANFVRKIAKRLLQKVGIDVHKPEEYVISTNAKRILIAKPKGTSFGLFRLDRIERYHTHKATPHPPVELYDQAKQIAQTPDFCAKEMRFYTLSEVIQNHVFRKNLSGDIVECGCHKGHSTHIIASLLKQHNFQDTFWIFDSFEGISKKSPEDNEGDGYRIPEGVLKAPFDHVKNNLKDFPFTSLHKGWIPEIFEKVPLATKNFALVHIDVDLYKPTKACLEYFYPRMSPGGIVFISNYNVSYWPGCRKAVDEFVASNQITFFLANQVEGCVIVK